MNFFSKRHAACSALVFAFVASASAMWSPMGFGLFADAKGNAVAFPQPGDSVYGFNLSVFNGEYVSIYGLSVAGGGVVTREAAGFEFSGLFNWAGETGEGVLQVAGIGNNITRRGEGVQISGIVNCAMDFYGAQIGCANISKGSSDAMAQIGAFNMAHDMAGVQIGAFNYARSLSGVQIGAFNLVEGNFKGIQLGAFNCVKDSAMPMLPVLRAAF